MPRMIDITGNTFGRLTAVSFAGIDKIGNAQWLCKCSCGGSKTVRTALLRIGAVQSCGCLITETCLKNAAKRKGRSKHELVGKVFGRLTVVEYVRDKIKWKCNCSCGNTHLVHYRHLLSGESKSCGCLGKEILATNGIRHGLHKTYLYKKWQAIKQRTLNPDDKQWYLYGGRGITLYEEWKSNFVPFYDYITTTLGPCPPKFSIDRIDNDRGYIPGNLRWASKKEQVLNRRPRHLWTSSSA